MEENHEAKSVAIHKIRLTHIRKCAQITVTVTNMRDIILQSDCDGKESTLSYFGLETLVPNAFRNKSRVLITNHKDTQPIQPLPF